MQPEPPGKDSTRENIVGSVEWVRAELDRMRAGRAGGEAVFRGAGSDPSATRVW